MNAAIKPYVALGKRELWEHRAFWIVPLVIVAIGTLLTMWGGGMLIYAYYNGYLENAEYAVQMGGINVAYLKITIIGGAVPFNIALVALVSFYLIDTLNADRRDRSILFWRSLPTSDTATVLSKLFTAMFTAPAIVLALFIGFEIIAAIILAIANAAIGVNPFVLFHPWVALVTFTTLAWAFVAQSLWLLPFYGWYLLCSAWAKRNAWSWVILVPVAIIVLEAIMFQTDHFGALIGGHIAGLMDLMVGNDGFTLHSMGDSTMPKAVGHLMSFGSVGRFMLKPEMWIGVAIGAAFTAGAIWLRRNRNEI
ncbi:MAG TPA: hypothetical protein VFM15_05360 [Gammaproteobacteria bacterium]|nr:hypothetical protein [Gammaproteobacteria bacterium]